ncbi:MAG: LytR C-terminal domain-containing protein [Actinobacteria bacterium]|nr:LytR C-terminal domain-containing protein [Actinomycetota bacterium]
MSYESAGRTRRPTSSGPPMGSTVAIVVTAAAVLLAFFILRKVNDSGSSAAAPTVPSVAVDTTATTLFDPSSTTVAATTTVVTQLVKVGTLVQVVNVSNQEGVARNLSNALLAEGFSLAEPETGTIDLPVTKVIYNPDDPLALPVAQSVAKLLNDAVVEASGAAVPTLTTGTWATGSSVIVLLGDDLAGKTLAQIAGIADTGVVETTTTVV